MHGASSVFDNGWFEIQNQNAAQIPAFGVMRVTDVLVVKAGRVVVKVDQPNMFGDFGQCLISGPAPIAGANGTTKAGGMATRTGFITALYDSADGVPAYGDVWGPQNGTWKLKKNTGGFFCLGAPVNTTVHLAVFAPLPMRSFYGKNAGSRITKATTGTINIFTGTPGSETDSGQTMANVLARFGDIPANAMVQVHLNETYSNSTPGWYCEQTDSCLSGSGRLTERSTTGSADGWAGSGHRESTGSGRLPTTDAAAGAAARLRRRRHQAAKPFPAPAASNVITLPQNLTTTLHSAGCPGIDGQTLTITAHDAADDTNLIWGNCFSAALADTLWRGDTTVCSGWTVTSIFGCTSSDSTCQILTAPSNTNFHHFGAMIRIVGTSNPACATSPGCGQHSRLHEQTVHGRVCLRHLDMLAFHLKFWQAKRLCERKHHVHH